MVNGTALNLGSGRKRIEGALNVDVDPAVVPDVVHDLNRRPWPFEGDRFDSVTAFDVIEHLEDVVGAMAEIHRVCRQGAPVRLTVPHFSCANAFTDPTHRHYFGWFSFHYFTGEHELAYGPPGRFRRRTTSLVFHSSLFNKGVRRLANSWPAVYERRFAWICPAWFLFIELEVLKNGRGDSSSR